MEVVHIVLVTEDGIDEKYAWIAGCFPDLESANKAGEAALEQIKTQDYHIKIWHERRRELIQAQIGDRPYHSLTHDDMARVEKSVQMGIGAAPPEKIIYGQEYSVLQIPAGKPGIYLFD